ncbi:hypothetical protein BI355_0291 [Companilactobacillus crustorum]|nr:hypothetical protein BI355_0291 [Companilactobacillus crustorum]
MMMILLSILSAGSINYCGGLFYSKHQEVFRFEFVDTFD